MNFPENLTSLMKELDVKRDLFMYAVVAMQDNRGIGNGMKLPWPSLKKDFLHYTSLMKASPGYIHDNEFYMQAKNNNTLKNEVGSGISTQSFKIDKHEINIDGNALRNEENVLNKYENGVTKYENRFEKGENEKENDKNEIRKIANKMDLEIKKEQSYFDLNLESLERVQKCYKKIKKLVETKKNINTLKKPDETVASKNEEKVNIPNKDLMNTSTDHNNHTNNISENPIKSELNNFLKTKMSKTPFPTIVVVGRRTWESMGKGENDVEGVLFVVLSRKELIPSNDPYNKAMVVTLSSFDEALCLSYALYKDDIISRMCVCGGVGVYKAAIESGHCRRLYVTRIQACFPCDTFMPPFQHFFQLDRTTVEGEKKGEKMMEAGVVYHFEEYALRI